MIRGQEQLCRVVSVLDLYICYQDLTWAADFVVEALLPSKPSLPHPTPQVSLDCHLSFTFSLSGNDIGSLLHLIMDM